MGLALLKEAESTTAYFKCGILGFQGSGKTYTASLLAIGIGNAIKNKTVGFIDTETGSDWLIPKLKTEGFKVYASKTRGFGDLLGVMREAEEANIGVLIIDSITHIWRDLCDAYDKKLNRKGRLQFQDWAILKGEWKQYTDLFINAKLHIIVCGRAGYEYDYDYNEDGSKDLIKTGTRMKVESEFGFEPSLVIEMERVTPSKQIMDELKDIKDPRMKRQRKQTFKPQVGSKWIHRAHILKDRADVMNGQSFDNPTFDDFKPHFDFLNIGGEHLGVDTTRTSEDRFDIEGRPDWKQKQIEKDIALEEIQATMVKLWPSTAVADKTAKADFLEVVFGVRSWTAIQQRRVEELKNIQELLKGFEQFYMEKQNIKAAWDATTGIDSLPDFEPPEGQNDLDSATSPEGEGEDTLKQHDRELRKKLKEYDKMDTEKFHSILDAHSAKKIEDVVKYSPDAQQAVLDDLAKAFRIKM